MGKGEGGGGGELHKYYTVVTRMVLHLDEQWEGELHQYYNVTTE